MDLYTDVKKPWKRGEGRRGKLNIRGRDKLMVGRVEGEREGERTEGRTLGGQKRSAAEERGLRPK